MSQFEPFLGQLQIRLERDATHIRSAHVQLERPKEAIRQLLLGQPPSVVLERLPLLFSLCAGAHQVAAVRAMEQAVNWQAAIEVEQARTRLTELELVRETLLRLVQDWHLPLAVEQLKRLVQLCQQGIAWLQPWTAFRVQPMLHDPEPFEHLVTQLAAIWPDVEALATEAWLEVQLKGLEALPSCAQAEDVPALDLLGLTLLLPALRSGSMEAQILGEPRATGPATAADTQQPVVLQIKQRVMALVWRAGQAVSMLSQPESVVPANIPGLRSGEGLGRVKTARGCLLHHIQLNEQQVVSGWQMLAPTDWNFHADGVLARQLQGLVLPSDPEQAGQLVRQLVLSIDPCVPFQVQWEWQDA